MAVSMSGRNLFNTHNSSISIKWNIEAFYSVNLFTPSVTLNNLIVDSYVTPLDTPSPNVSIASFI